MDLFMDLSIRYQYKRIRTVLLRIVVSWIPQEEVAIIMVTRSLMVIVVCFGFPIIIQTLLPKAMALRKAPNVDEYMIEDRRTHRRHNYVVQRGLDDETSGKIDNRGPIYETESFEPETSPEELPELIVDYANMIRNDIILLDNSVETRTRKRGNIKKYNQAIPDPPCSCESIYDTKTLGSNFYPEVVPTWKCNDNNESKCPPPYRCKETYYQISVLRSKENPTEKSPVTLPPALRSRADTMRKLAKCDLKYDEMKKLAKCEQLYTKDDSDRTARIGTPFTSFQRN